jgi:hypothetical protein
VSQFTLIAGTIGCWTFEPAKIVGIILEMRLGIQWSGGGKVGDLAWRNPITGIGGCCARAASGHAAAPPSSVMNSRRFMLSMGSFVSLVAGRVLRWLRLERRPTKA